MNMRVISRTELTHRTARELAAMYAWITDEMLRARYLSPEWEAGLLSLENIRREQASRRAKPRGPKL
jgi:hypothetical protein